MKIEVGQTVFLKPINNRARYQDKEIVEAVITKVGRKYFNVNTWSKRFKIDELIEDSEYASNWKVYASKQEILDEEELEGLSWEIRQFFTQFGKLPITLKQVREIHKIIKKGN